MLHDWPVYFANLESVFFTDARKTIIYLEPIVNKIIWNKKNLAVSGNVENIPAMLWSPCLPDMIIRSWPEVRKSKSRVFATAEREREINSVTTTEFFQL